MIAEPFAKQAELDRKTARFNEIMDILNPKEEQIIGDEEDAVRYQAREKAQAPFRFRCKAETERCLLLLTVWWR